MHTVDLFQYQAGSKVVKANAMQIHPNLGIAMDMSTRLQAEPAAICTLSLSFNNAIDVSKVDVSMNGIELQDREFIAAIRGEGAEFVGGEGAALP